MDPILSPSSFMSSRFRTPAFGGVIDSVVGIQSDLDAMGQAVDASIASLGALRNQTIAYQRALVETTGAQDATKIPDAASAAATFNRLLREQANQLTYIASYLQERARAVPLVGEELAAKYGNPYAWADALFARVPLLRPATQMDLTVQFGFPPAAVPAAIGLGKALVVGTAVVVVAYLGVQAIRAFNTRAGVIDAEAQRQTAAFAGRTEYVKQMAAAGFRAEQIQKELERQGPVGDPPEGGESLVTVLKYGLGAALVLGSLYLAGTLMDKRARRK